MSTVEDEIKKAEKRGYSKGYAVGKRRQALQRKNGAFWQRAFLAALPAAIASQGWKRGNKPLTKLPDKVQLAAEAADEAMKYAAPHLL